jgi:hypothetical protein
MKNILATVGAIIIVLALLGNIGIGHFRLSYSVAPMTCVKVTA